MIDLIDIKKYSKLISGANFIRFGGKVSKVIGLTIEAEGLDTSIGELCYIFPHLTPTSPPSSPFHQVERGLGGEVRIPESLKYENVAHAKVVGFRENETLLMPFSNIDGIRPGSMVVPTGSPFSIKVGDALLGRIINALGEPMDGNGSLNCSLRSPTCPDEDGAASSYGSLREPWFRGAESPKGRKLSGFGVLRTRESGPSAYGVEKRFIDAEPPPTVGRQKITQPIATGVKAIDGLMTLGRGQRMGIFAGSGVGKSVLMGMIARNTQADVNVIALIGERRREVQQFIEDDLRDEGLTRSVVVVATSDQPALMRIQGAMVATTIAEYFRDTGKDVMLMMDSITRLAMAQREVGLAIGEPPTTRGYTPSVFALLPKLLERAGTTSHNGSVTGLYTVLVEADDMNEPVADTMRSILDGHIVLSRELAAKSHYPAIDVLNSISRLMWYVTTEEHQKAAQKIREVLAIYNKAEDLINIGAYISGSDPKIDYAIEHIDKVNEYLIQERIEKSNFDESISKLIALFK